MVTLMLKFKTNVPIFDPVSISTFISQMLHYLESELYTEVTLRYSFYFEMCLHSFYP